MHRRGQMRVHLSRLSDQATTINKAIEHVVPALLFEAGMRKPVQQLPSQLNAPWRWREKQKNDALTTKWLRPGF